MTTIFRTQRPKFVLGTALVGAALVLAGCGGDAATDPTTDAAAPTTDAAPAATDETTAPGEATTEATETEGAETDAGAGDLAARLPEDIKERGVLRIATVTSTTPLTEKPGRDVTGLVPDLAHAIAEELGVEVEFIEAPMSTQIQALQSDRADITWSAMTPTAEREDAINMVPYIAQTSAPIVQEGNPDNIQEARDLCGKKVGIVRGGNSHVALEAFQKSTCEAEGLPAVEAMLYEKSTDGMLQVQSGQITAFVGIGIQLKHVAETANGGTTFDYVDTAIDTSVMTIGTAKDDMEMAEIMRDGLFMLMDSGKYQEVLTQYGGENDILTKEQVVINPTTNA